MMGILQRVRAGSDGLFNRLGTRLHDVRYGESLIISPRPQVTYLGPQSTVDFISDLSPAENLDTWQVLLTRTAMLANFGSEPAFLAALQGNSLWYVRRHLSEGWIRTRSYGTPALDSADSFQVVLKSLGFNDTAT
ncbi:MAG: hypothetical protein ACP5RH_01120 [Leptodesmis sp.]|uniref:hypothetical protein n=1 Tax=Leptodesmis sp. TaxID=3100501 RepID=UPI003D0D7A2F